MTLWGTSGIPKATPSTPPVKKLPNQPEHAPPAGRSVAGQMVQNNRSKARANVPHAPARRPSGVGQPAKGYNALESPYKTQGQFNQAVKQTAQAQYQPELDQFTHEQAGETGLHNQREGENASIYNTYSAQAKEAFERAKNSLAEVASHQNASSDAAQKALQAALGGSGIPGLSGPTNPGDFMQEATNFGNQSGSTLAGIQSAVLGEASGAETVPGAFRNEAQTAERQRDQSKLNEVAEGRQKVLGNIPNVQAKVRGELSKQEQEREGAKLQSQVAQGKLGLEKQDVAGKRAGEKEQIKAKGQEAREANALKYHELAINAGFESQKIAQSREELNAKVLEAKNTKQKLAAELGAKRYDHGLEIMAGLFKINPKTEYTPVPGQPPTSPENVRLSENGKLTPHHVDPMHVYNALTKQSNLTAPEAFHLMQSTGDAEVEAFAREHEAIFNRGPHPGLDKLIKSHPMTPLHKGK